MTTPSLRPYQVDSVEQLRQHFRNGSKRPLLVAPTGSGKTTVANYIIEGAVAKGGRAVFLAARRELVHQASARLSTRHGVILSGNRRVDQEAPVQVASVQTLLNRDLPWEPTLIILDEAHHSTARTHQELLQRYPETPVIGLSATPVRTTGLGLADYFTSMVQSIGISSLIQQGYLVPVRHLRPPERGKSLYADPVEMWLRHAADRPTMAFASNVQESIALVERFNHRGIPALHIDANTPDEIRDTVSQQMGSGAIKVVSGYAVYVEGVDIPCLSCVILDRKTSSLPVYLQAIGRGLREYPGKENCIAEGQLVLTDKGLVPIEKVCSKMRLWDGESWIPHGGIIFKGYSDVIEYAGLTATKDHLVWTKHGWKTFGWCCDNRESISTTEFSGNAIRESENIFSRCDYKNKEQEFSYICKRCLHDMPADVCSVFIEPTGRAQWWMQNVQPATKISEMANKKSDIDKTKMLQRKSRILQKLRGKGNTVRVQFCNRSLHMDTIDHRPLQGNAVGSYKQLRALCTWEHKMVDSEAKYGAHTKEQVDCLHKSVQASVSTCSICGQYVKQANSFDEFRGNREKMVVPIVKAKRRVWDILECGPLHRFTVSGLLVHNCTVLDHGANILTHGRADCDRTWVLTHGKDVLAGAATPDVADNYRVCPICYTVANAPQIHCTCGYKFSVKRKKTYKHKAGTLEVHHDNGTIIIIPEDKRRKEFERFLWQQRNGRKKDGSPLSPRYASYRFFQQFGVWPPREWVTSAHE